MIILGISCFYHDAAAAVIRNGTIMAAAQEERFTRKKHDAGFPSHAIAWCLQAAGCTLQQVDAIVFYDKPFLKFERLLETYYQHAPVGFLSFVKAMPVWLKEKLFIKNVLKKELTAIDSSFKAGNRKILFTEHHLAHAASAFFVSPFAESAILTIDGVGEWATASIAEGKGNSIRVLKELVFPDSVGLLYSAFTYFLGFKVNSGEYKLMGLAPYGNAGDAQTAAFVEIIEKELVTIFSNGSIRLAGQYFNYATGLTMIQEGHWQQLFGIARRSPQEAILQVHCNLALAIQSVTEKIVLQMASHARELTGMDTLCMAGGVALNCVANGKLQKTQIFRDLFIQPAAGDAGGALGAALAAYYIYYNQPRAIPHATDAMKHALLGPAFSQLDIEQAMLRFNAAGRHFSDKKELIDVVAKELAAGKIVGWFNGSMEFGPRALGNRSILASPLPADMQQRLNQQIKFRESFRPFAPITTEERAPDYFDTITPSPYMLLVHPVKAALRCPLPADFEKWTHEQKLAFRKSELPAITHVDFSCRLQTVSKASNEDCWQLLNAFKKETGYAVLINTSFNVRGEPLVCTPAEAYTCFMHTGIDILVLNKTIFYKADQPAPGKDGWAPPAVDAD